MTKIQIIKYLELKGINEMPKGKSVADLIREFGEPTIEDMVEVNKRTFEYYVEENSKLNKIIDVLKQENESMKKDVNWLRCLQQAGVDNWEGCDTANDYLDELDTRD